MPYYESIFIVRQDVSAQQVEAFTTEFADIIRAGGGQVPKTEQWGLRTLAYRIKKNRKGHYVLLNLDASPAAVAEMERNMRLHEDVLRFMTVSVDELETAPSAMMRRDDREDRGDHSERAPRSDRGGEYRPRRDHYDGSASAADDQSDLAAVAAE